MRKTKAAKPGKKPEAPPAQAIQPEETQLPRPSPAGPSKPEKSAEKGGGGKTAFIVVLAAFSLFFTYYYFVLPQSAFIPDGRVDAEGFKNAFGSADRVYIVMDVRGVADPVISNNILQCGVDFAGSSGMGGKNATFFSLSDNDGCVAPDGVHPLNDCASRLKDGITIYVKGGPGGADYFNNGMVVTVGANYATWTCGIRRV